MNRELLRSIHLKIRQINDASLKSYEDSIASCSATGVQFGVLRNISDDGTTTMSELIQKVKCAASNMTALIQRMERDDLVKTVKNPADKRETFVILTLKGKSARDDIEPRYDRFLERNYGQLTSEEQLILNTLLTKLEATIELK